MGQSTSRNLPFTSSLNRNSVNYHSNNTLNDPNSDISSKSSPYIPSASSSSAPSTIIPQSTFRSRRLSSLSLNISKRRKKANFLKHFKKSQPARVSNSPTVTDMADNQDVIQEDDQSIDIFHPNHDPVVTPSTDSSIDSSTEVIPSPIELEQSMTTPTTESSNTIPLERHESIQETINMSDILGTEYPIDTRESLIQNEYSNIVNHLEGSLLNQFQTLSNLLENVTMTTLRRLIAFSNSSNLESLFNNNSAFPTNSLTGDRINNANNNEIPRFNNNPTPEINVSSNEYNGVRIDQINPQHNDQIIRDANFNEFIQGLNDEHLLHRELGLQIINEQNLNFFRAFRFNNSNQFGFNSRIQDFERLIPVLIVGVVGLTDNSNNTPTTDNSENNNDHGPDDYDDIIEQSHTESMRPPHSTTETDTSHTNEQQEPQPQQQQPEDNYRSWIIIVMAHHYSSTDPVLQSMPLFINLLTSYVTTNNSNSFSASNPDQTATGIPATVSPLSSATSSDSSNPDLESFRNSLFQIFNKNHNKKLTQFELDKYKNTLFKFKSENSHSSTEAEDDVYHDTVSTISSSSSIVSKLFEKNDRCPICLIDYESNDIGRFLSHCKHEFHKECIDQWLLSDNSCPICRGKGI